MYIDPWQPVKRAIITHSHSDHVHSGSGSYLCHQDTVPILRWCLAENIRVEGIAYHQYLFINGVSISLHLAGHIIGSAQVRLEYEGEVWLVSGDCKLAEDGLTPSSSDQIPIVNNKVIELI